MKKMVSSLRADLSSMAEVTRTHFDEEENPDSAEAMREISRLCGVSRKGEKKSLRFSAAGRNENIAPPLLLTQIIFPTCPPPMTLIFSMQPGLAPAAIAIADTSCIVATSPMRTDTGVLSEEQP